MDEMQQVLRKLKGLSTTDVEGLRDVINDDLMKGLDEGELLTVYDKILDFVDMTLDWDQQSLNPNIEAHRIITLMFRENEGGKLEVTLNFKLVFHHIRNKTKFLYMMAFTDAPCDPSVFEFLGNYLNVECDTGILVAFILKSNDMKVPDNVVQFWLRNSGRFFYHDPSCKSIYRGMGEIRYHTNVACNSLLGTLAGNIIDIKYMKLLYPSFVQVQNLGGPNGDAFDFDIWISQNWSQKWIVVYYNVNSMSLFAHIPNKKIYELLLDHPDVSSKTKSRLRSQYDMKGGQIKAFVKSMANKLDQANLSIPDILPDDVKRVILEKTVKASFREWRHHACTFHGDEEGESRKNFDIIFNEIFSSRSKAPSVETKATPRSFTTEQKKAIKKLAKKYKNAFEELKSP